MAISELRERIISSASNKATSPDLISNDFLRAAAGECSNLLHPFRARGHFRRWAACFKRGASDPCL
eukprot:6586847-Pyramimonas_sp.AAC.1